MTILQALSSYYDRLDDVAKPGWSPEKFGWCIVLDRTGKPIAVDNLHDRSGKKPTLKSYVVPASFKRPGTTPRAFFLWDNTKFSLGVTKSEDRVTWERDDARYTAFRTLHMERLADQDDEGLVALRLFLDRWRPEQFAEPPFKFEMLDANIMFRLDGELRYLHERPAAKALVELTEESGDTPSVFCLITGKRGPVTRVHPTIKGVVGALPTGASLVSFNHDSFTSLGKKQGENAPTSEAAAFRYGTALNHMLVRDSRNRIRRPIGDATMIFWADAGDHKAASAADDWYASLVNSDVTDEQEAAKIRSELEKIAEGKPISELRSDIAPDTRFYVLGLSPVDARLSVRFWQAGTFDQFAHGLAMHFQDLRLEPPPCHWGAAPSVNRLLVKTTAILEKFENIPPLLAGEVMRAVLTGERYPQSLLVAVIMRLRAGARDNVALLGWRAAVIRAVLERDARLSKRKDGIPVSLKQDHQNTGYQLGRLFAVCEWVQEVAIGSNINASIRDKYFGAASATPASVFPLIVRGAQSHLAKARKNRPGSYKLIERYLNEIFGQFTPETGAEAIWPRHLRLQDQGEFAIGYYHQRAVRWGSNKDEQNNGLEDEADDKENEE